jgi:hypothetical protein
VKAMLNIDKLIENFPLSNIAHPLQHLLRRYKAGEIDRGKILDFLDSAKRDIKIVCNGIDSAEGRPILPWDDDK